MWEEIRFSGVKTPCEADKTVPMSHLDRSWNPPMQFPRKRPFRVFLLLPPPSFSQNHRFDLFLGSCLVLLPVGTPRCLILLEERDPLEKSGQLSPFVFLGVPNRNHFETLKQLGPLYKNPRSLICVVHLPQHRVHRCSSLSRKGGF